MPLDCTPFFPLTYSVLLRGGYRVLAEHDDDPAPVSDAGHVLDLPTGVLLSLDNGGDGPGLGVVATIRVPYRRGPGYHQLRQLNAPSYSVLLPGLIVFASALPAHHWLRPALVAGAVGTSVLHVAGEASWFTLARQPTNVLGLLREAWLFHDLADSFFVMENFPALVVTAVALAAVELGLPRWARPLGLVVTAIVFVNSILQLFLNDSVGEITSPMTLVLFVLWILLVSVLLRASVRRVVGRRSAREM